MFTKISDSKSVADEKLQGYDLVKFSDKWNLEQMVKNPTRLDNILDMIFVNSIYNRTLIDIISNDVIPCPLDLYLPNLILYYY